MSMSQDNTPQLEDFSEAFTSSTEGAEKRNSYESFLALLQDMRSKVSRIQWRKAMFKGKRCKRLQPRVGNKNFEDWQKRNMDSQTRKTQ